MRETNAILLDIIEKGILNARLAAREGDPLAWLEADHVHNLPGLIRQRCDEGQWTLEHYWSVDRAAYLSKCKNLAFRSSFDVLWSELAERMGKG